MAQDHAGSTAPTATDLEATKASIMRMVKVGAAFAAVGYLLTLSALALEFTQFHPLLENFFRTYTDTSLAGGSGGTRTGTVNGALAEIHKWPSTLLWLKLGGIAHVLTGIFVVLAAIVRALAMMPDRLGLLLDVEA